MLYKLKQTELVYLTDEFGHSYEIEGEAIAGVTTLLSLGVPADPGLINFWKSQTAEDQGDILQDAQERGSNVHQAIEHLLLGRKVSSEGFKRPREKKAITSFMDWFQKYAPKDFKPEMVVAFLGSRIEDDRPIKSVDEDKENYGHMRFAGTVDFIGTINGKRVLIDFKTSAAPSKKNSLQVQAYKQAVEQSLDGEKIDECYVLYLGTKHTGARPKMVDGLPDSGFGWQIVKSNDTFDDFKRAYDMAIWCSDGYPKPPKVMVYPKEWDINVKKEGDK